MRLTAYDLWRLVRGLGVGWQELASVGVAFGDGFRLDAGPTRFGFRLRQRPSGACALLVEVPAGPARCGVHPMRPAACRLYPFHLALDDDGYQIEFGAGAACPPAEARGWKLAVAGAQLATDEEVGEHALYTHVLKRWDEAAGRARARLDAGQFVDWSSRLYDALSALQSGARSDWHLDAVRLVRGFALPGAA